MKVSRASWNEVVKKPVACIELKKFGFDQEVFVQEVASVSIESS